MSRLYALLLCILLTLLLPACGTLPRRSVPAQDADTAAIPGLPDIRAQGNIDMHILDRWMRERIDRERAFLQASGQTTLPDAHYLALSGGGTNGAYGAGLLCGWTQQGDRPAFRIVTGISAGALIAPFAFVGPKYDHVLKEVFTTAHTRDIATRHDLVTAFVGESVYSTKPLRALLERHIDDAFLSEVAAEYRSGRSLFIATTDMDSLRPVIWAMGRLADSDHPRKRDLFIDILMASSAIPGVFPPVFIDVVAHNRTYAEMHMDGGAAAQVFLFPPAFDFARFVEESGAHRSRTLYVIRNGVARSPHKSVPRRTLSIAQRAVDGLINSQGVGDLYRIYLECQRDNIAFRVAIMPPEIIQETAEFFDPAYMSAIFEDARSRASTNYPWSQVPPSFNTHVNSQ
jgi:predicted acylesterase/phospholipase RssA